MNPYYYPQDDPSRQHRISLPPHLHQFPHPGPIAYPYAISQGPPMQPFAVSYPLQASPFSPAFVPQQFTPHARHIPPPLLDDPAFSPDPRSNPHFFSMNSREEIYPASLSDSLSDYAPTVADDESDIDHANLPPRMRLLNGQDVAPPRHHARSQSVQYIPAPHSQQNLSRSSSARVIPIPPPISRPSTSGSHLPKPPQEDPRVNVPASSLVYASASAAVQDYWQPPPPYSDSETESSSSSNPQTPSSSPPSSSYHLPRDGKRSSSSLPPPEKQKRSVPPAQPVSSANSSASSSASSSSSRAASQPRNDAPASKHSTVQSSAVRPPITPRNASAPELHPPPPPVEVPPRPSTVPIPAPPPDSASAPTQQRRRNSKKPSVALPPQDLDSIDELDESDPLGFAWHHGGPYEAIAKATSTLHPDAGASRQKRTQPPKRKPVQPFDSVSVGIAPGQIFPTFSQYQPQDYANGGQQVDPSVLPAMPPPENFPIGSPPMSPLALPVQRRVPPTGLPPPTPDQWSNMHMATLNGTYFPASHNGQQQEQQDQQGSRMRQHQQPQPTPPQTPPSAGQHSSASVPQNYDAPQPSPPLPNPYSPTESAFPNKPPLRQARSGSGSLRPSSIVQTRPELPPSNVVPRPDIALPPPRQEKPAAAPFLPRYLPKRLVMPAPLQQGSAQSLQPGQAHIEIVAQRPGAPSSTPSAQSVPSNTQHQTRAKDIPVSHGPKVLKKRHTLAAAEPSPMPAEASSNSTAAMFAARVRFAEPAGATGREETKEERKRREKEEAKREKEAKKERERAKKLPNEIPLQGIFAVDYAKEAELGREREMARSGSGKTAGKKLSKRR